MNRRELAWLLPLLALYVAMLVAFPEHQDDESAYVTLAERLTHGTYVTGDQQALLDADPSSPDLWFGPGLPGALAPLAAVDAPLRVMRLTGPLFLFAAMCLFYVLVRRRWDRRTALVATYGLGLYPPFWPLLPNVHSEPLAVLCMAAAMLGIARFVEGGRRLDLALASGALAGLALTRVAYGWVLVVVLAACAAWWLVRRNRAAGRTAAALAVALVACAPWLAYTHAKTDRLFQWGNSGSLSLYWMTSPYPGDRGDWQQADKVFSDPALAPHRPFFSTLRGLTLSEQNAALERQARHNIDEHPLDYAENVAANTSRMLFNWPYSRTSWEVNDLLYAVSNVVVLLAVALVLVGVVRARRSLPAETGPFAILAIVAFVLHVLVATYPRMLTPIVPLIAWLATLSAVRVLTTRRQTAPRRTPLPTATP